MSVIGADAVAHKERKAVYERVCRIVRYQTAKPGQTDPPLPRLASRSTVRQIISRSNIDLERGDNTLRAAIENGDVIVARLDDGDRVAPGDQSTVEAILAAEVERERPRKRVVAACNNRLDELRESNSGGGA